MVRNVRKVRGKTIMSASLRQIANAEKLVNAGVVERDDSDNNKFFIVECVEALNVTKSNMFMSSFIPLQLREFGDRFSTDFTVAL